MNKYIIDSDRVYESFRDEFFEGYAPVNPDVPKNKPWLSYIGPKILIDSDPKWEFHGQGYTWKEVQAFFVWVYKDCKSECQVRCYYNKEQKRWRFWAFPQEHNSGMTTREIPERCDIESNKMGLFSKNGWLEGGTIHSHAATKAFQSGTDSNNELSKIGIHITIGNVDEPVHDLHGRMTFRKQFYQIDWSQWFVMPEGLTGLPGYFRNEVMQYFLQQAPPEDYPFPGAWKENMIKVVHQNVYGGYRGGHPQLTDWRAPGQDWYQDGNGQWLKKNESKAEDEKKLSPRAEKRMKKLIKKKGFEEGELTPEEAAVLNGVATQVLRLCSIYDVEASELFKLAVTHTSDLGADERKVVDGLEEECSKSGVGIDQLECWILGPLMEEEVVVPYC